ncbi:uncharacterized protein LOC136046677 [Cyrtonyx montezumae]|uniref:uncharacterized protein LOC136046677 n=1 Tax=Cyrtonyx montezumae TaxID=9017 RepID=UPI0032DA49D8
MRIPVASGILPLLLLTWLPAGLAHQSPHKISVPLWSNLTFQCLPWMVPNSPDKEVVWCSSQNKKKTEEKVEEDKVIRLHGESGPSNLTLTRVKKAHAGNYTCRMRISPCRGGKNKKTCPCKSHEAIGTQRRERGGQSKTSAAVMLCRFMVWVENKTVHVRWWTCPELHEDTSEHCEVDRSDASPGSMDAASAEPTVCNVSSRSFIGMKNATQGMISSSEMSPTHEPQTHKDLLAAIYMYVIPGLVVVTLFFLLCISVCLCRRNRRKAKGNPESKRVAEMNQLSTPPPAPQTEDVTYAKLIFEKTGTIPEPSEVVYTEIKPLQKK